MSSSSPKGVRALAALCALAFTPAHPVRGDDLRLLPALFVKEEYNDNILFTSTRSRGSLITTLSAGLVLLNDSERLSTKVDLRLDGLLYSEQGESLDALEQRYGAQASYLISPLLRVSATTAFSRESRPDRFLESSGLVVRQDSSHQAYTVAGEVAASEKASAQAAYGYDRADYHDGGVSDFARHTMKGTVSYDLGGVLPLLKVRGVAALSLYRYTASTVRDTSLMVGIGYPFRELWSIQGDIGGRLTHREFSQRLVLPSGESYLQEGSRESAGFVTNVLLTYGGEREKAALAVSRDIQNAAGLSGAMQTTVFSLLLTRGFSDQWAASLGAGYYLSSSQGGDFSGRPIDYRTVTVTPSLRYQFSRALSVEASYDFARVDDRQAKTVAQRNKVFICLTLQKPA